VKFFNPTAIFSFYDPKTAWLRRATIDFQEEFSIVWWEKDSKIVLKLTDF
jgi:hypothetical protein